MLLQGSRLLLGFTCFLALFQATVEIRCSPGQRMNENKDICVPCPPRQFRTTSGSYMDCLNCIQCKNSTEIEPCTPISNTKCECWQGFSFLPGSKQECRCKKGSGIETLGNGGKICKACPNGTFSNKYNSDCQPWKTCDHNGIKVPGTGVSDVSCQSKSEETNVSAPTQPPHPTTVTHETSANASAMVSTRTATTRKIISKSTTPASASPGTKQMQLHHWLVPLSCVLALLLIQLAIVKLKIKSCFHTNKTRMIRQDSACGKPVEESGEKFIPPAV